MAWSVADIPDLRGRVALVTGASGGLGLETTVALAGAGAHVVLAARNPEKSDEARARVLATYPSASAEVVHLDLASLASVAACARAVSACDLLILNAGVMATPQRRTFDGFELQFGVDHLGHFALTAHLLPALLAATAARVVTVTSLARFLGPAMSPADPHLTGRYGPWRAYAQAKMANFDFALGLQRRFSETRAASLLAHPGFANTELQATTAGAGGAGLLGTLSHAAAGVVGMTPAQGALPQLRAATDPRARGGQLYAPRWGTGGPPVRRPVLRSCRRRVADLWAVSERETGVRL